MVRSRYPDAHGGACVACRFLGWATASANLCILAFTINEWPVKGSALAAGIAGSCIAMLNDSWIFASTVDTHLGFLPIAHSRAVAHDLFSLAISLGGIVMMVYSRSFGFEGTVISATSNAEKAGGELDTAEDIRKHGASLYLMLALGVWTLTATVLWRFVFVVWGLYDCFSELRTTRYRFGREIGEVII